MIGPDQMGVFVSKREEAEAHQWCLIESEISFAVLFEPILILWPLAEISRRSRLTIIFFPIILLKRGGGLFTDDLHGSLNFFPDKGGS